jgi:hypothetical protein
VNGPGKETGGDRVVRAIKQGMVATFEMDGSFVRLPAPCDGVLIETRTTTILVPLRELTPALQELARAPTPPVVRPRIPPSRDDVER